MGPPADEPILPDEAATASQNGPWALRRRRRGPPRTSGRSRGAVRHAVDKSFETLAALGGIIGMKQAGPVVKLLFYKFTFCKFQKKKVSTAFSAIKNFPSLNNCPFTV